MGPDHHSERLETVGVAVPFPRTPGDYGAVETPRVRTADPTTVRVGLVAGAEPEAGLSEERAATAAPIVVSILSQDFKKRAMGFKNK